MGRSGTGWIPTRSPGRTGPRPRCPGAQAGLLLALALSLGRRARSRVSSSIRGTPVPPLRAGGTGAQLFIPWFLNLRPVVAERASPTWNPWAQAGMPLLGSSQGGPYPPKPPVRSAGTHRRQQPQRSSSRSWVAGPGHGCWPGASRGRGGAAVGGLGFGLCAFLFANIGHQSMIAGAAWLPGCCTATSLCENASRRGGFVPGAAVAAAPGTARSSFMDLCSSSLCTSRRSRSSAGPSGRCAASQPACWRWRSVSVLRPSSSFRPSWWPR